MKNRNKPLQAAIFFCVIPLLLATGSCTTQDKKTATIHPWTKDVNSLAKGKADSRFWSKVRSRSTLVDAFKRLGGFYQKQGKYRKAIAEFIKAIKMKTGDASVYNSLAMSYDALKEYKYAEMAYKDAIALAPEQPYLFNNYGCSCLLRGDIDAAVDLFEKAASLDMESHRIKNNLSLAIYWGNKDGTLKKDNLGATKLSGQYVTERVLTNCNELKEEFGDSGKIATVLPDEVVETVEVEAVSKPIIEDIQELVKETALLEPTEIQPEVEDAAINKTFEENIAKREVAEEVQVEDIIADEAQLVLDGDVVAETVDDVEEIKLKDHLAVKVTETGIDETISDESHSVIDVTDDEKETESIAARSSVSGAKWYNKLMVSVRSLLGFESDETQLDASFSADSDQPAVILTNTELTDEENASLGKTFKVQEKVVEESIADTAVTEDEQQVVSTKPEDDLFPKPVEPAETAHLFFDFEGDEIESPTVEKVVNNPLEEEVVETAAVTTVDVPEENIEAAVDETEGGIAEVVSTEDDVIEEKVAASVQAISIAPDVAVDDMVVTAQANERPEDVNKISVDTKASGIIHVKALFVADTVDDISSKPDASIAEAQIPTLNNADSVKQNVAWGTDKEQKAQSKQKVAIEVSNGNGVEGMAGRSAAYFSEQGRYVGRVTNAKHFGFENSTVFYRKGYLREAYNVALMVPGYQEMKLVESLGRPEINVKILLGKDIALLGFPESMAGISYQQISNYGQTVTMVVR